MRAECIDECKEKEVVFMGVDAAIARGAIRASLGNSTTEADLDRFVQTWNTVAGSLLKERSGLAA